MGSSFSVVNNSDKPIWVDHGVCKAALFGSIAGVLAVATAGAGAAVLTAGAADATAATTVLVGTWGMEGLVMTPAAAGVALAASTVGGLTAAGWSTLGTVSGLLSAGSGITAGLTGEHRQRVLSAKKELEKTLEDYTRVESGDKYTVNGSLSLVLTAYVIYDDGQRATRDCWTGPTHNSENEYPVTEYF